MVTNVENTTAARTVPVRSEYAPRLTSDQLLLLLSALRGIQLSEGERAKIRDRVLTLATCEGKERMEHEDAVIALLNEHREVFHPILPRFIDAPDRSLETASNFTRSLDQQTEARAQSIDTPQIGRQRPEPRIATENTANPRQTTATGRDVAVQVSSAEHAEPEMQTKPHAEQLHASQEHTSTAPTTVVESSNTVPEGVASNIYGAQESQSNAEVTQHRSVQQSSTVVNTQTGSESVPISQPHAQEAESVVSSEPKKMQQQDVKARIAEIKHFVNENFGNPVNIIEVHPTEGRQYMSALLAAMKAVNSGSKDAIAALNVLEQAFAAVQERLRAPEPATADITTPTSESVTVPPVNASQNSSMRGAEQPPAEKAEQVSREQIEADPPVRSHTAESAPQSMHPSSEPWQNISAAPGQQAHTPPLQHTEQVSSAPGAQESVPISTQSTEEQSVLQGGVASPQEVGQQTHQVETASTLTPLSEVESAAHPAVGKNEAAPLDSEVLHPKNTLVSDPKVEAALRQLLSEWSIFKKSGWFGTGPNGAQHPLYQRIKDLKMASVVAGRFEGATQTVKQNLSDYMNGWRYEHGIVHDLDETFEQYLTRVITKILASTNTTGEENSEN